VTEIKIRIKSVRPDLRQKKFLFADVNIVIEFYLLKNTHQAVESYKNSSGNKKEIPTVYVLLG